MRELMRVNNDSNRSAASLKPGIRSMTMWTDLIVKHNVEPIDDYDQHECQPGRDDFNVGD